VPDAKNQVAGRGNDTEPKTQDRHRAAIEKHGRASRHHLEWASAQAANYVLAENDWRDSIRSQGVMETVWLVATTYLHADGSAPSRL
jgi:hypothetical protein